MVTMFTPEPPVTRTSTHVVDATMFWSPTGGGVRRYLLVKQAWLSATPGWRHTIAVPVAPPAAAGETGDSAISGMASLSSIALPGSGGYRLPLRRGAVARVLETLRPDLIEAADPYRVAWSARDAAERLGIPAVAYCHSNLEAMARLSFGRRFGALAARTARRYLRHVYSGFDLVLAPSRAMLGHLHDAGIEDAVCQPLGVDTSVFRPSADPLRTAAAWRVGMGLDPDARVLVYAGRFAPEKHLEVLTDAVARLGAPYVLVAIGAGPAPPSVGARVRIVPFMSSTAALATALASADVFVHAGDQETFGLSALEALACGTPIVVPDTEGLGEMVDDSSGIAVRERGGKAFAAAIAGSFARDREAWRASTRRRAETQDWDRVFTDLTAHYTRLLARATPSSSSSSTSLRRSRLSGQR